ncbi:MAG: hypothetical protein K8E66_06860 [Phycisphaerales bacterium]|nr:hypothetical protein [Phycisphaerales bacterium]
MRLPLGDWQFWIVSVVVLAVVLYAARPFIPGLRKKPSTRVDITIDRRKPDR